MTPTQTRHRVGVDCPTCGPYKKRSVEEACLRCGHQWDEHRVGDARSTNEGACFFCRCRDYVAPCEGHRLERVAEVEPVAGEGGL